MFKWIGAIGGVFLGLGTGIAGFGDAINGWWFFGLLGLALGYWIDNEIRERSARVIGPQVTYTISGCYSCADFLESSKLEEDGEEDAHIIYMTWVMGFITGVNYERAENTGTSSYLGKHQDWDELSDWLVVYCRNHPEEMLADAVEALLDELKGNH